MAVLLLMIIDRTSSLSWVYPTKFIIHFFDSIISEVLFSGNSLLFYSQWIVLDANLRHADCRMVSVCLLLASSKWCNTIINLTFIAMNAAPPWLNWLQFLLLNFSFSFRFGTSKVIPYDIPVHFPIGFMLKFNAKDWFKQAWLLHNEVNAPCIVAEKLSQTFK